MKNTKRTLLVSLLSLLLCFSMLIGTTLAWFTDTATTGVNKIVSGTLDIDLVDATGNSLDKQPLTFINTANVELKPEELLWEPGATYLIEPVTLVNKGNLAVKYQIILTLGGNVRATTGENLADVIEVIFEDENSNDVIMGTLADILTTKGGIFNEGILTPNDKAPKGTDEATYGTVKLHMQESAGNAYQCLSLTDLNLTVYATQFTYETDSFNDQYDKDAYIFIENLEDFKDAVSAGGNVLLGTDLTIDGTGAEPLKISKNTRINLNGRRLTANASAESPAIVISDGAVVTFSGGTIDFGDIDEKEDLTVISVTNTVEGATTTLNLEDVVINAGKNSGNETAGIVAEAEAGNVVVNITDGTTINAYAQHSAPVVVGKNANIVMDGGEINASQTGEPNSWTSIYGVKLTDATSVFTMNGGTINADGQNTASAICANAGTVNLNGGIINVTAGNTEYGYSIGIEAYNATLNLNGGTINVMSPGAYDAEALDVTSQTDIIYNKEGTFAVVLYQNIWSGNRLSEDASVEEAIPTTAITTKTPNP